MSHYLTFSNSTVGVNWDGVKARVVFPSGIRNEQHHHEQGVRTPLSDGHTEFFNVYLQLNNSTLRDYYGLPQERGAGPLRLRKTLVAGYDARKGASFAAMRRKLRRTEGQLLQP